VEEREMGQRIRIHFREAEHEKGTEKKKEQGKGSTWNWKRAPWAMAAMHATMDMKQMNVTSARKSVSASSNLPAGLDSIVSVLW
jgi:hypothetical protein